MLLIMETNWLERLAEVLGVGGFLIWGIEAYRKRVRVKLHRIELADDDKYDTLVFEIENVSPSITSLSPSIRIRALPLGEEKKRYRWRSDRWVGAWLDLRAEVKTADRTLPPFTPKRFSATLTKKMEGGDLFSVFFVRVAFVTTQGRILRTRQTHISNPPEPSWAKFWILYVLYRWFGKSIETSET